MTTTYKIVRHYQDPDKERETIEEGLTLEEAQAHCNDPSTSGDGWFDGYYRVEDDDDEEGPDFDDEAITYEVSIRNTFDATSPEDAVRQMIEWLRGDVGSYGYRVEVETDHDGFAFVGFYDGEDV